LGELVYDITKYPKGITFEERQNITPFHQYIWASVILSEVQRLITRRETYYTKLGQWEEEAVKYNQQVADIENLVESLDNQGWTHQAEANSGIDFGEETSLFSKRVAMMVDELPACPVKPKLPEEKINISLDGAKFVSGFGTLTSGDISLKSKDLNTKKAFGVFGQGKGKGMGFTNKPDQIQESDGKLKCRARYIALNLYPLRRTFLQTDEVFELTAVAEANKDLQMSVPGALKKSVPA